MTSAPVLSLGVADWFDLFTHFVTLSLLSVGGAISTVPDMHRYLVLERAWLSEAQFAACLALAQAAPGPNVLFVALMGWNVGLNAAGGLAAGAAAVLKGLLGVAASMGGILLPSSVLSYNATQWAHRNRELRAVRAFKAGLAPIVVALLLASAWVLAGGAPALQQQWRLSLLTLAALLLVWRTRIHLLWLLAAGGLLGALGWV
jgi:chromate transporter